MPFEAILKPPHPTDHEPKVTIGPGERWKFTDFKGGKRNLLSFININDTELSIYDLGDFTEYENSSSVDIPRYAYRKPLKKTTIDQTTPPYERRVTDGGSQDYTLTIRYLAKKAIRSKPPEIQTEGTDDIRVLSGATNPALEF
ncbi:MAG: hypothetical protein ABSD10_00785 [Candidatus Saccharimonadales bacterium]|jgi:hypothetical protein